MPNASGAAGARNAAVNVTYGSDAAADKLRLDAAKDLVERCKRQLAGAEADLARLGKEQKGT